MSITMTHETIYVVDGLNRGYLWLCYVVINVIRLGLEITFGLEIDLRFIGDLLEWDLNSITIVIRNEMGTSFRNNNFFLSLKKY
jgi:hypothetical protein